MNVANRLFGAGLNCRWVVGLLIALTTVSANAEISLTLKNSFIQKYKNRATIDSQFVVDHSKGKPNPASKDADMHVAGRDPQTIGMPTVAEIMNAKEFKAAVDAANEAEGTNQPIAISGAWRIWNEHSGDQEFTQGKVVPPAKTSNPDHVFEIHPIVQLGEVALHDSFHPIEGYEAKHAEDAFFRYEQVRARIIANKTTTTIISNGIGYNYVVFQMVLNEKPFPVDDGAFAFAKVQDESGHLVLRKKRMVFLKNTPPEIAVRNKGDGDCLKVLGIPRLDLSLVDWRVKHAKDPRDPLHWNLPYEMIVVGVYNEACEED